MLSVQVFTRDKGLMTRLGLWAQLLAWGAASSDPCEFVYLGQFQEPGVTLQVSRQRFSKSADHHQSYWTVES
jgi:hypothetical protein